MSKSSDPRNFFESDAQQHQRTRRKAKSSNKWGSPIQLKSKLLAVISDPHDPSNGLYVAEAAGCARHLTLSPAASPTPPEPVIVSYRGPTAPITSVAVGGPSASILFGGCWDKSIWSWDIATRQPSRRYIGHSDFVKAVVCARISGTDVLISGGADSIIIVWDVSTGKKLHTLQDSVATSGSGSGGGGMMAVQDLVVDPVESGEDEVVLFSAGSDPHIRRWRIRLDGWEQIVDSMPAKKTSGGNGVVGGESQLQEERRTLLVHETGVYKLTFSPDDEADLWTASADGTTKCLARLGSFHQPDDTFEHGDHVRTVAVTEDWVITAGRDEDIKLWNRSSGELHGSLEGHFDEVTGLVVLRHVGGDGHGRGGERLISVSIDGTVRCWPLERRALDALVQEQIEAAAKSSQQQQHGDDDDGDGVSGAPETVASVGAEAMTREEEAELAALMDEEDDE